MLLAGFAVTAAVLTAVFTYQSVNHRQQLVGEWSELFQRCRTSIELRVPVMATALTPVQGNGNPTIRVEQGSTLLAYGGSRFAILDQQSGAGDALRHTCQVVLADWSLPLDEDEIAALLLAFITTREHLQAAGTHQFRQTDLLPPTTMMSFGLRDRNPAGCTTIAYVLVETATRTFSTAIGEQDGPCITGNRLG